MIEITSNGQPNLLNSLRSNMAAPVWLQLNPVEVAVVPVGGLLEVRGIFPLSQCKPLAGACLVTCRAGHSLLVAAATLHELA